jgi:hypothetical protein
MKTYCGMEVKVHASLTSALDRGKRSAARFFRFLPGGKKPGTTPVGSEGGWIKAAVVKRIITAVAGNRSPALPTRSLAIFLSDPFHL